MTDKCIMCGAIIPEGRWICPTCENNKPNLVRNTQGSSGHHKHKIAVHSRLLDRLTNHPSLKHNGR